ncbi:MAG TPA: Ig-like domain-containing protein [Kofleriaceae bacterium]|nr:Ig-like domain-containing protein [Kofleriaceae bacterium]
MDPTDVTAPMVVSTMPAANATGIGAGSKIVVVFSEPMDPATIEAAYASSDLPTASVSLNWNEDLTVLTITPSQELAYAEGIGTDPSAVTAKAYSLSIGSGAADLAGNRLAAPLELVFATKKRMSAVVSLDDSLTRVWLGGTLLSSSNDIWIGDNAVDNTYRSYITFDLAPLPTGIALESAQFSARQLAPVGLPYGSLGAVKTHHVSFATLNNLASLQAMSLPGTYSEDGTAESKAMDVTAQVADDLLNRTVRGNHTQYRLQIDTPTNNNATTDKAIFAKGTFEMNVVYVAD